MTARPDPAPTTTSEGTVTAPLGGFIGRDQSVTLFWYRTDPSDGAGRTLLLIGGLGSPSVSYEDGFVDEFVKRGCSVVRFDNRDVGRSSRIDQPGDGRAAYDLADMANDAVAVLDAVGWDRADVLGQSMGGMIAQQLAVDHPHRVRSLVSLMSSTGNPNYGRATPEAYQGLLRPAPPEEPAWLDHRVETERLWASPGMWDPDRVRAKGQALLDHGIDVDGANRQYQAIVASGNRDGALETVAAPTLVIHGSADTLIQPDGGRHTADVIPNAVYLEIDGLGHDLPPEFWDRLATEVTTFIARVW